MEAVKGGVSRRGDEFVETRGNARIFLATLFTGTLILAGCVHWPDVATDCDAYGVAERNQPMGSLVIAEPLFRDELDVRCADVREATARINPNAQVSGCVIPGTDGIARAYYWKGDTCAFNHELCHAKHGPEHTERYLADLQRGIAMPYCPESQL